MRIVILYPTIPDDATLEDQDSLVQVEAISQALGRLGHEATMLGCTLDLAAVRRELIGRRPEVVFNLMESIEGADSLQYLPPAMMDALGVPYTGVPTEGIFQTTHKLLAKRLLHLAGLPTPAWLAAGPAADGAADFVCEGPPPRPSTPWIVKAVWEHASRGLDDQNIVADDTEELRQRLGQQAVRSGRPWFAEQFIEGREFNLSLLGDAPEVLPCAEIDFSAFPPGKPRIVGHRAKWQADSFEFHNTPRRFDFPGEDDRLLEQLGDLAKACWTLFGLRGYARVDFRVDAQGRPWILEINANPCLSPDAGFVAAAARAGITFDQLIQRIVRQAAVAAPAESGGSATAAPKSKEQP
jgi:D-alanine-D-alanine ligase